MSRANREKHLKTINLLSQAVEAVTRLVKVGNAQACLILLAECQDSAVALGNHIEKLYGLETKTVRALEQYCENLYQFSVAMEDVTGLEEALIALKKATELVHSTYEAEFPDKKEVVFLPYNASMWDSLESVWMAARDDEECDAYVVPIPYYSFDENHCVKEFHYEGDRYPDYVPITSYQEYDLELRHPDMIFIHNPYDECNAVTSVAPEYYAVKIKDYTEKLVYIPYYVLSEIEPDDEVAIENMKHFCYLPGTRYADQVIVQSENMREIYINEYLKAAKEAGEKITREELEKRILGLGSPKLDKVNTTKVEDLNIPDEWLKLIVKSDGSWKKIIFYNTSLTSFLKAGEQMLRKIQDVFRIFKENQEDVALLWRPHPLMQETVANSYPELWEQYQEMVQQYREEGWGIYDDSAELERAVGISDAYYGDSSSVVTLYQETGKPVMIQDVEIIN